MIPKNRHDALTIVKTLTPEQREAIAFVVETAETQGDYNWNGEDSVWEDNVCATLNSLAKEIRTL